MARVPYLLQDDLPEEYQHLFKTDPDDPADVIVRVHRAMANNPKLFSAWGEWARTLYDEMWDARLRELVILAVANVCECTYVWHQHVPLAQEVGIDDREILAIHQGDLGALTRAEQAAVTYATAIVTNDITDEIHVKLSEHVADSEIVTIAFLASEYEQASSMIDALGIEIDGEFVGWRLENAPS